MQKPFWVALSYRQHWRVDSGYWEREGSRHCGVGHHSIFTGDCMHSSNENLYFGTFFRTVTYRTKTISMVLLHLHNLRCEKNRVRGNDFVCLTTKVIYDNMQTQRNIANTSELLALMPK